jgi:serine protease DegQ
MTAARHLIVILGAVFFASGAAAADSPLQGLEDSFTELVFGLSRSIVTVEASDLMPTSRFGRPTDETYTKEYTTGVVVDSGGLILVPARPVIGRERITVRFDNQVVSAEVVAIDYQTELALLRAASTTVVPVELVDRQTCAGQMVVAVGHAQGFRSSPSLGFCAGIRDDGVMQFSIPNISSQLGTGVFDLSGRLLGIITELVTEQPSLPSAVPAHRIKAIVSHLLNKGDRRSGFAGIRSQEIEITPGIVISPDVIPASSGQRYQTTIERGVVVTSVVPLSPASRAGLTTGDLIYAVDGMGINSAAGLASMVKQSEPGTALQLSLLRRDQQLLVSLIVGRKSLSLEAGASSRNPASRARLADSIRQTLIQMKGQIRLLENRLDELE